MGFLAGLLGMGGMGMLGGGGALSMAQLAITMQQQQSNTALSIYLSQIENQQLQQNLKLNTVKRIYQLKNDQLTANFKTTMDVGGKWYQALGG